MSEYTNARYVYKLLLKVLDAGCIVLKTDMNFAVFENYSALVALNLRCIGQSSDLETALQEAEDYLERCE